MDYFGEVKLRIALLCLIALANPAQAQTNGVDLGDMLDTAQQWAQENLDEDVLKALQTVDREKVADFLAHYQDYLKGDYVLDLAQLRDTAKVVLPLLEAHPETQPYAAWLRARLDYFDAAEALKKLAPPPPPKPGKLRPPPVNPTFKAEQEIWIQKLTPRPWPQGAEKLVPELKAQFAAEGVPTELVWLAEVESGFTGGARSPAGAVGMFQLMPATAKHFGLSLWPWDQREQTKPAARAAAKYLHQLHGQFGDWRLAIAAYNCGAGTVQKALTRYHAKSFARIAPHLPAETQMYVPKVEALIRHREGAELEKL